MVKSPIDASLGRRFGRPALSTANSLSLVQIQVDAYMFTLATPLATELKLPRSLYEMGARRTHRSIHAPGTRHATLLHAKPSSAKTSRYHGSNPALRTITRPPTFNARFRPRICFRACFPSRGNQSMLSITTTMVSVPGRMRATTSPSSSV